MFFIEYTVLYQHYINASESPSPTGIPDPMHGQFPKITVIVLEGRSNVTVTFYRRPIYWIEPFLL